MKESLLPPITLARKPAPVDVKEAIKKLDGEAEREEILGAAHIVLYKDRRFGFILTGECDRNPLYTRCLVAELDDDLSVLTKRMMEG
jgi:hypothetical protein